jgi:hypothetical protein
MRTSDKYPKEEVISILKEWASPVLVAIVGMLLWRDVTEMRADIKLLLTQQSADRVKIEQLEDDVKMLKQNMFKFSAQSNYPENGIPNIPENWGPSPAILQRDEKDAVKLKPKDKR